MFPGPDPIPAVIDCPALANTGLDSLPALIIGLAIVAFGILFLVLSRGRLRRGGAALGLVLLLAAGGAGLAVSAPASSASADDCTPRDYAIQADISPLVPVEDDDTVTITFAVINVVDRDGSTPIVVRIPKTAGPLDLNAGSLNSGANWAFDDVIDPANYVFTYSGPLPKGTMSSDAVFVFTVSGLSSAPGTAIPVTIDTGSGGDTVTSNNSVDVTLVVEIPPVP